MIPHGFSRDDLSGKARCRAHLLASLGLAPEPSGPVFAVVSRLTGQKGLDLLVSPLREVLAREDARFVALGAGDPRTAATLHAFAREHPRRVHFHEGYSKSWRTGSRQGRTRS
jgi:starch synthase